MQQCKLHIVKTNYLSHGCNQHMYLKIKLSTCKMCYGHYEEQDPGRSFFMVEAFRRIVRPTRCLLVTGFMYTNKLIYI